MSLLVRRSLSSVNTGLEHSYIGSRVHGVNYDITIPQWTLTTTLVNRWEIKAKKSPKVSRKSKRWIPPSPHWAGALSLYFSFWKKVLRKHNTYKKLHKSSKHCDEIIKREHTHVTTSQTRETEHYQSSTSLCGILTTTLSLPQSNHYLTSNIFY